MPYEVKMISQIIKIKATIEIDKKTSFQHLMKRIVYQN